MTNWFDVKVGDDGLVKEIVIHGLDESLPVMKVGGGNGAEIAESKSALYAASDFFRFHRYENDKTEVGLHWYNSNNPDFDQARATNIAVVSTSYNSNGVPSPDPRFHPEGWAQLNVRRGRYFFTTVGSRRYPGFRARKHDWIDYILEGHTLQLNVAALSSSKDPETGWSLVDRLLASWHEKDDEKAWKIRNDGLARRQMRNQMNNQSQGAVAQVVTAEVTVTTPKGQVVPIVSLPYQPVLVTDKQGRVVSVPWDGSSNRLLQLAIAQGKGFALKTK